MKEIIKRDAEFFRESDDYGAVYEVKCPDCSCNVRLSDGSYNECDCRDWFIIPIMAKGIKK